MTVFSEAILAKDIDAIEAMLADDVVFRSPILFKPYTGPAITAAFLRGVVTVFEDFSYVREIHDDPHHAYEFTAKVDGLEINGCDFITYGQDGKIIDFTVMVRPLRATQAFQARMAVQINDIMAAAAAATH
jgi:SnoaL-like domain